MRNYLVNSVSTPKIDHESVFFFFHEALNILVWMNDLLIVLWTIDLLSWEGWFILSTILFCLILFFYSRKPHFLKSIFCGLRWASKTSIVSDSYKRYRPWIELETCCADLKSFAITLHLLGTVLSNCQHH
jgi:hypothetical protein